MASLSISNMLSNSICPPTPKARPSFGLNPSMAQQPPHPNPSPDFAGQGDRTEPYWGGKIVDGGFRGTSADRNKSSLAPTATLFSNAGTSDGGALWPSDRHPPHPNQLRQGQHQYRDAAGARGRSTVRGGDRATAAATSRGLLHFFWDRDFFWTGWGG